MAAAAFVRSSSIESEPVLCIALAKTRSSSITAVNSSSAIESESAAIPDGPIKAVGYRLEEKLKRNAAIRKMPPVVSLKLEDSRVGRFWGSGGRMSEFQEKLYLNRERGNWWLQEPVIAGKTQTDDYIPSKPISGLPASIIVGR